MKVSVILLLLFYLNSALNAQETVETYQKAITLIKLKKGVSSTNIYATGSQSLSFKNQAYAFWLDGEKKLFKNREFDNFYGDFMYESIEINAFKKAGDKRKSQHQLFVTETVDGLFVIELLSRKRKLKPNYPAFYQGESTSFLFEKIETEVRLVQMLQMQNN